MHQVVKEVKTAGKVVANLSVDCYDSLDELLASVKPEDIVSYYNTQKIENERNNKRAEFQPDKASKDKRLKLAFQIAFTNFQSELAEAVSTDRQNKNNLATEKLLAREDVQKLVTEQLGAPLSA